MIKIVAAVIGGIVVLVGGLVVVPRMVSPSLATQKAKYLGLLTLGDLNGDPSAGVDAYGRVLMPGIQSVDELAQKVAYAIRYKCQVYSLNTGDTPPSLNVLVKDPNYIPDPKWLTDPWNKPYQYDPAGQKTPGGSPDVWTVAPSGKVIGTW